MNFLTVEAGDVCLIIRFAIGKDTEENREQLQTDLSKVKRERGVPVYLDGEAPAEMMLQMINHFSCPMVAIRHGDRFKVAKAPTWSKWTKNEIVPAP